MLENRQNTLKGLNFHFASDLHKCLGFNSLELYNYNYFFNMKESKKVREPHLLQKSLPAKCSSHSTL